LRAHPCLIADDGLALRHKLPTARVVFSEQEAADLELPIDHDDSLAMKAGNNFALLLHGMQPKGSKAATARQKLLRLGKGGYSSSKRRAA
jgi:hypothetical protein